MHSSVRRYWYVLWSSLVLTTACTADNTDCGGPTSDWPFCRDRGGGLAPALNGGDSDGNGTPSEGAGTTGGTGTGGDSGSTATNGATAGSTGQDMGGETPSGSTGSQGGNTTGATTGGDGGTGLTGGGFVGCCDDGSDAGTAPDADVPDADPECGMPLDCSLEMELDGASEKSLTGSSPLDFTQASVEWKHGDPEHITLFLRALDSAGNEVRLRVHYDDASLSATGEAGQEAPTQAGVATCGGEDPGPIEVTVNDFAYGWGLGFSGTFILQGAGWSTELTVATPAVCDTF